jgi:ribosomal 50S subunit-recycling heat shock protein
LKVSRLSKRRTEAKEGIDAGRVTKADRILKAGYDVKVDDVLVIHYRTRFLTVRVRLVPERVLPSLKPADLYEIVDERKDDPRDWLDG